MQDGRLLQLLIEELRESEADECLRRVGQFALAWHFGEPEQARDFLADMKAHHPTCGGCQFNVLKEWEKTKDSERKRLHHNFLRLAQRAFVELNGGRVELDERDDGRWCRWVVPPDLKLPYELPYRAVEVFTAKRKSDASWVVFDVASEDLFRHPNALLQHLDVTATRDAKRYDVNTTPTLHWAALFCDRPYRLDLRWQGRIRTVFDGYTLYERYRHLIASRRSGDPGPTRENEPGIDLLTLRELANRYDEKRAWFAGFASRTLKFRKKDAKRKAGRDPLRGAVAWSLQGHDGVAPDAIREPNDIDRRLKQLAGRLTPRQREILIFKAGGMSDARIGKRIGLTRESVNRERAVVRRIVKKLPK